MTLSSKGRTVKSYRVLASVIREMYSPVVLPESFDMSPKATDLYKNWTLTDTDRKSQCAGVMSKVFDIQKEVKNKGYATRAEYERAREYAQQVSDLASKLGNVEKHNDIMNDSLRSIFDSIRSGNGDNELDVPQDLPNDREDKEAIARDDNSDSLQRRSKVAQNKMKIIDNP